MFGIGALGLGATSVWGFLPRPALAQGGAPTATAFFSLTVGKIELTVIRDAQFPLDGAILGANAPTGAVDETLKANNLPTGTIATPFNVVLVKTGDKVALLDTGNGVGVGALVPTLALLGVTPEMITDVVFSHLHPDHVGAALTDGKLTFPKAMYSYPEAEKAFVEAAPAGTPIDDMLKANKAIFKAAGDASQLNIFKSDAEVLPGVLAVAALGHSMGHHLFRMESEGSKLLLPVDTAINSVVSLAHPEWYAAFDTDGAMAAETRKKVFSDAAATGVRVLGYHFPFPGTGFIDTDGDGFRFIPAM
jgi:glyoxylase-like metal-dependent hydrolase (beta-lactamase superfamily II)